LHVSSLKLCLQTKYHIRGVVAVEAFDTHKGPVIGMYQIFCRRTFMRFYKEQHQFYTGIDLHARTMYVWGMNNSGSIIYHKNMPSTPESLQHVISLYGTDNVIGVECIFTWYWIADFCSEHSIPFALGHALYRKRSSQMGIQRGVCFLPPKERTCTENASETRSDCILYAQA
jgi:hypothetical protein